MIQAVLPIMKRQRDGRIVNIVGQAARHPHSDRFPSGVTNAAVMAMTKSVADAVARDNIRVNAVCPLGISPICSLHSSRRKCASAMSTARPRQRASPAPTRSGEPARRRKSPTSSPFWLSDRSNFTTGRSVSIDGGYHRYVFG